MKNKVLLKTVSSITSGSAAPKENEFSDKGLPFIRAGHLEQLIEGSNTLDNLPKVDEKTATKLKLKKVNRGTILFAKSGMSSTKNRVYLCENEAYIVSHLAAVIPNEQEVKSKYLKYFIEWFKPSKLIVDESYPSIRISDISAIEIDVPSINEQDSIIEVLDICRSIIKMRKSQIAALDELSVNLFLKMFGDPVLNTKKWLIKSFDEFAIIDTNMTKDFDKYAEIYHIGIDNIEKNTGKLINLKMVKDSQLTSGKYIFNEKHIIYSKIRPYLNKVALPDFNGLCSADAYPLLAKENVCNRYFLAYLLRSNAFLRHVSQNSDRTNIPKVNKNQLKSFSGILPPIDLQQAFEKKVLEIEERKEVLCKALIQIEILYDSLLQKNFKGELFQDKV